MKEQPLKPSNPASNSSPVSLSPESLVRRQEGVVLRHVAGEHMLVPSVTREVDLDSLFLLNATGVFVWEQLDGLRNVAALSTLAANEFSIDSEAAQADVINFCSSLLKRKLADLV